MSEPFLSEIRMMSFGFAPRGWAQCNGQLLPINQNQALFALLGTTYGGNGQTNFALPDLRGRAAIGQGSGLALGQRLGVESHVLSINEMPLHTHAVNASRTSADSAVASNAVFAATNNLYGGAASLTNLAASASTTVGGSQAHNNMQPFLTINFCIALQGIFPSQN